MTESTNEDRWQDLIERAKNGDREALGELAELCQGDVERFVHHRLWGKMRSKVDTMDLVQTTMREALVSIERFEYRGPGSFQAWIRLLADRKLSALGDYFNAQRRDVNRENRINVGESTDSSADFQLPAQGAGPITRADDSERKQVVRDCVNRLGEPHRTAMQMGLDGLKAVEIAQRLSKPEGTVRSILFHGRRQLHEMLRDSGLGSE